MDVSREDLFGEVIFELKLESEDQGSEGPVKHVTYLRSGKEASITQALEARVAVGDAGRGRAGARSRIIEPQNLLEGVWTLCSKGKGKPSMVVKPGSDAIRLKFLKGHCCSA